ncbi:MAG TPA: UTP--glucose-1-phosphate uridylyltransferase GalU [Nitrosospira sp.]|nr:UTP--glucose-1-phosphate uridylyltransferase GalU [Nitrosospira sp.]
MPKITKAVFPVAGMGTRFLPATKASPKEMMPVVDKPLIQYAAEEAVAAGIRELIFITGRHKRAIEDHFDKAYEMEAELEARHKYDTLAILRSILPKDISCIYIRQPEALGLGHAISLSRPAVGNEPFAVLLADDLLVGNTPVMQQLAEIYEQNNCSILAVENIEREETSNYGIVKCEPGMKRVHPVTGIVEKPRPEDAPSTLGVVGRYILTPGIFRHLEKIRPGAGGEIQLTDGIASLLEEERVLAYEFRGIRYDCGSKLGYLKATVAMALEHPEVAQPFAEYLATLPCCRPLAS